MANSNIFHLGSITVPLAGTEVLAVVQGSAAK